LIALFVLVDGAPSAPTTVSPGSAPLLL